MGSLANLYISQSYTSLIHLGSDTTASANFAELQDGLGNGLGISVNTEGDISASHSVKTLDLFVMNDTELSGAFNLNTYITASTIPYFNSIQPYFSDVVYVTGSYAANTYPPSIADVEVGWLCNGIGVTNGVVTAVSKSVSGYYITVGGQFPQQAQHYTFTGRTSPTAHIYGALEISENLVVSGTFDIEGKVVVNDDVVVNGTLSVSSSTSITGALDVRETLTASAALIENDLIVSGTLFANKVVTLIESSSIIYSSGSNILGDEVSDTQTLIGATIMSGSAALSGSMSITNNLSVTNNISSSTISGIGNVTSYSTSVDSRLVYIETTFSTSVDSRLDYLEGPFSTSVDARLDVVEATASLYVPFSTSVDSRLDEVEATASYLNTTFSTSVDSRLDIVEATASLYVPFSTSVDSRLDVVEATASLYVPFSTSVDSRLDVVEATASLYVPFSSSVDFRLDELEAWSSSLQTNFVTQAELDIVTASLIDLIDTKLNTSSYYADSASFSSRIDTKLDTSSYYADSASFNSRIDAINFSTLASTGSNTFVGNQTITGSVYGNIVNLQITSLTASMDCSTGNFFNLTLSSSANVYLNPTNIRPGQTISLKVNQPATVGTLFSPDIIKYPSGSYYNATSVSGAVDILTFVSYDTTNLFGTAVKRLQ